MLKNNEKVIVVFQGLVDGLLAAVFWLLTYYIRFRFFPGGQEGLEGRFFQASLLISVLTVYWFRRVGLYRSYRLSSRQQELLNTVYANLNAIINFVVLAYFIAQERLSRGVILGYLIISVIGFSLYRIALRSYLGHLRQRGLNLRHVLLVGHGQALNQYVTNVLRFPAAGVRFSAWFDSDGMADRFQIPSLEGKLEDYVRENKPDSIVINYERENMSRVNDLLKSLHNDVVPLILLPDLTYSFVGYETDILAGVPAQFINHPHFSTSSMVLKRLFDVVASVLGLVILSPILAVLALLVRLSSPGPIFYGQERVGLDGHRFRMWKYRSMKVGSDAVSAATGAPGWTTKDDARRTRVGTFLRATSLDELPQLWNVLVGDMSLVGPRPEQPYYVEKFRSEIPAYMLRHKMKAGITGWAQVNGWRGDTSLHKRIECDLYYIRNWSLLLDFKILFLTLWRGFLNKNAY